MLKIDNTFYAYFSRMESEMATMKLKWESHINEMSRDNVSRDVELNSLKESESNLKLDLQQRKLDIERFLVLFWSDEILW